MGVVKGVAWKVTPRVESVVRESEYKNLNAVWRLRGQRIWSVTKEQLGLKPLRLDLYGVWVYLLGRDGLEGLT